MRFMTIYKPGVDQETAGPPSEKRMAEMGAFINEMAAAGVLLATDGLQASSKGARVKLVDGDFVVTDGPFAETKELIAGYAIVNVASKDEAIHWTKRFLALMGEGESEIRLMHDFAAFDGEEARQVGAAANR
ncbi:MAG: hypothetical protein JWM27_4167 [Gemmatimonadetes bacterium]|nr:hypothetical protein [Gemmatimonadota bacterium]